MGSGKSTICRMLRYLFEGPLEPKHPIVHCPFVVDANLPNCGSIGLMDSALGKQKNIPWQELGSTRMNLAT